MKIGILTFHNTTNYGAYLQSYALQQNIKRINSNVEIIDYHSTNISRYYMIDRLQVAKGAKKIKNVLFTIPLIKKRIECFEKYESRFLMLSESKYTMASSEEMFNSYDCIVSGSDQVFNLGLTNYDPTYLIKTDKACSVYKIAYAASLGNYSCKKLFEMYSRELKEFNRLSIREGQDATNLSEIIGREVANVLDPTFLLKKEEWISVEEFIEIPSNYIFLYLVSPQKEYIEFARKVSKKLHKKIVYIPYGVADYHGGFINISVASPGQFLYLIHNADLVITNSFHGTALSINYEKDFMSVYVKLNSRIESILELLNLEKNLYNVNDDFKNSCSTYDYSKEILEDLRVDSLQFLEKALEEANENFRDV